MDPFFEALGRVADGFGTIQGLVWFVNGVLLAIAFLKKRKQAGTRSAIFCGVSLPSGSLNA
jgi:hypothetical protein